MMKGARERVKRLVWVGIVIVSEGGERRGL